VKFLRRVMLVLAAALAVSLALLPVGSTPMADQVRNRIQQRNEMRQRQFHGPIRPRPPQRPMDHYLRPFRGTLIVMAVPGCIAAGIVSVARRRSRRRAPPG